MPGPVDLVLARIDDDSILIVNGHRGLAVVDRRVGFGGQYEYRYRVVRNVRPSNNGGLEFDVITQPATDPLRMVGVASLEFFGQYLDERSWLRITMGTLYPDSVVAMCRHMLWAPHLKARAKSQAADLVVTANPGWQFSTSNKPGTAHGHPFVETMRMSFFVAGPNIRREAIVTDPVRSVDLLPTILEMAGVPFENHELDGRPIRSIYQPNVGQNQTMRMPMIWQDVDLGAWAPRQYAPREVYPVQPKLVNRPDSFRDLNNAAKNTLSVTELRRVGTYAASTVLDRWLLDGLEDRTDRVINMKLGEPAELPADQVTSAIPACCFCDFCAFLWLIRNSSETWPQNSTEDAKR